MFLHLLALVFVFAIYGCTNPMTSTLLSSYQSCKEDCPTSTPGTISGELAIRPEEGEIYLSPEGSDLVEITGSCSDLGRKSNRILVQVYEGEDDARTPIIDNSIDVNCQDNISTSSLVSSGACLLISQGIGIADTGQSTSQYPQCFNGRFSFQLRMGRIIRKDTFANDRSDETNPKVRYLVKMKLRTTDSITSDSAAATLVVNRSLPVPVVTPVLNRDNDRCELSLNPSKFRDIRYSLFTTWTGPSWAASGSMTNTVSGPIYVDKQPTFPPVGDGTGVEKFYHFGEPLNSSLGLLPGVTYTYRVQAGDYSFRNVSNPTLTDYEVQFGNTAAAVERSVMSPTYSCVVSPAYVANRTEQVQGAGTPNTCTLQLGGYNLRTSGGISYKIEWRVSTSPNWMVTTPNSGFLISDCNGGSTCSVHGDTATASATTYINASGVAVPFSARTPYYFSARHYVDSNTNNQFDPGIDQIAGDWSPPTNVTGSTDFNHRCTFNTYPPQ